MDVAIIAVLAIAAFAIIIIPVLSNRGGATDAMSDAPVEDEIERYRAAVRADTLCSRCGQANPPGSRFCYECGKPLAAADAEEFDGTEAA